MSNSHLVLAHLVDTNPTYAAFYRQDLRELSDHREDFVIMDNGAFELGESYDPDKLIDLGFRCNADAIVLPDYPFEGAIRTIHAAREMAEAVKSAGFMTMFVPQSTRGDLEDWIGAYEWAADYEDIDIIGMSILGIPNALPEVHKGYARVVMTQLLIDRHIFAYGKHHHYLGLNAGPALEIPSLLNMGVLNTIDSSNPVWAGINNVWYDPRTDSYLPTGKDSLPPVNFDAMGPSEIHQLSAAIQYNVKLTLELFEDVYKP